MKRTNTRSQRLMLIILFTGVMAVLVGVLGTGQVEGILDSLRAELIPNYGQQTDYGIPLDLRNTAQFVDWFYTIELNESEQALKDSALSALVAPCCDDNSAATCCCECNIPGLVNVDYRGETFSENVLRIDVSSTILVYCRSGGRSAVAVQVLRDLGFCCLYDMDGGILAWTGAGYPTE